MSNNKLKASNTKVQLIHFEIVLAFKYRKHLQMPLQGLRAVYKCGSLLSLFPCDNLAYQGFILLYLFDYYFRAYVHS